MDEWFVGRRITVVGIGQLLLSLLLPLSLSPSLSHSIHVQLFLQQILKFINFYFPHPGVDHQELVSRAEASFSSVREGLSSDEEPSHYYGGEVVM